jgi:hypothetical protein
MPSIENPIALFDAAVVLAGIVMIGKGLYMVYPPLMYIVIGIILAFPGWPKKEVK